MRERIAMVGPSIDAPGGMSAVVAAYRDAGLFASRPCDYISSYSRPGIPSQLRSFGTAFGRVGMALLRRQVALLHLHSASRGSFWRKSVLAALARLFRVPYLFHIHSGEFPHFYAKECSAPAQAWVRHTLRHAARVLTLTRGWEPVLKKIEPRARIEVIPNPVPMASATPDKAAQRHQILFLGRVREKKGAFDLLKAMPAVLAEQPQARLVLAGDGEIERAAAMVAELGIGHAVQLMGWIDGTAKQRALDSCGVFVLPSYFEGLPIGILEAMAQKLVVVATAVGGIPDLVHDQANGVLVPAGDPRALAAALVGVLADPSRCERLSEQALRDVQVHDACAVVHTLETLYDRVCSENRASRGA